MLHYYKDSISKYLGMFIDSNLKWDDHINNMIPKTSAKIGILRSLRNSLPNDTLIQIFNAIMHPTWTMGMLFVTLLPKQAKKTPDVQD